MDFSLGEGAKASREKSVPAIGKLNMVLSDITPAENGRPLDYLCCQTILPRTAKASPPRKFGYIPISTSLAKRYKFQGALPLAVFCGVFHQGQIKTDPE
jgi:hypothetical protein